MAVSNYDRVGKAMEILKAGLAPFVEREVYARVPERDAEEMISDFAEVDRKLAGKSIDHWDVAALLNFMWIKWNEIYSRTLGNAERSLVSELRDDRNKWAHQDAFTTDDAYRALDSASRLLSAISAPEAEEIEKSKNELLRIRYDEQVRNERRKSMGSTIDSAVTGVLKPWREVITPHHDVATGQYQQAEFAADLWQVYLGEGSVEYQNPIEFYRRTYLTDSLKALLTGAVRRLSTGSGDPVVQLQTNFGGGKTHSMLALYHLFSGVAPGELVGIDEVMKDAGVSRLPEIHRVVLVGNRISPGQPSVKPDGTIVRTLWGEIAWQLGGKAAYDRIALDDKNATSPGDTLRLLFNDYGPCLVLIDEWVAYARQLHNQVDLPAGDFETHFSFAQALTESAKLAKNCLLVISLPASDDTGSPHTLADNAEVGGERGREALIRLRNVVGRIESSWRPATAEEGFEIVRRRLFEPLDDPSHFKDRDIVARAFSDFYFSQKQEFPPECSSGDYEKRIKAAYPIHPEVFDRLYSDWSALLKFQRTRGVLRLMAAVIHSLWEKGDRNPLIMPANIPIDDPRVQSEMTRYLSDNWVPIIEKDVDGPEALPLKIDSEVPNLGKFAATRRVARTIYLGSAPIADAAHHGIEDRRIKLGSVMPGESPTVFGDALRRLASSATYLFQDGSHFWYSTQPTVTKLAEDRAEQLNRNPDAVIQEIETRLRVDLRQKGDFSRVHAFPHGGQDVPDDRDTRLVVLGIDFPYSKESDNPGLEEAKGILESRGSSPRLYRNTLVFLAPDKNRLQDLDEAVRRYLAWQSIIAQKDQLNLSPFQVHQAEQQLATSDATVNARVPETYQWLLVPVQSSPQSAVEWQSIKISGQEPVACRASKKLRNEELLILSYAGTRLRMDLDKIPLWRGSSVSVKQLAEDYARYLYLPRLAAPSVLVDCVRDGVALLTWEHDAFAWADAWDESAQRFQGLRAGQRIGLNDENSSGLLVKPEIALQQMEKETKSYIQSKGLNSDSAPEEARPPLSPVEPPRPRLKRFHGTVTLDPDRVGRDAGRIAEEVITHLAVQKGSRVTVTLEIQAELPEGANEALVRTVTENANALKFDNQGFERE
jgi:predicted AAA+ superfamily ATPase